MSAGILNQVSFKKESTWGTAVVPDKSIPVHPTGGIQTDNDVQLLQAVKATLAANHGAFIGARNHEGDYELDLFADYPGYFILGALGAISTATKGGETIVFQHTITEQETKPSFTIEQVVGENVRRYAGSLVSGFDISGKAGESIIFKPSIKAKSQASATKITPAYLTTRSYNFLDAAVKIGGSQINEVQNFDLQYSNNLELVHTLNNSNDAAYNYVKGSEVKGTIELYLDSTSLTEMNNYLSGTTRALDFVFTGDAIGVSSNNQLTVSIPKAMYTVSTTELSEDFNLVHIEFEGLYDTATSKLISAVIINLLANYN